VLGNGRSLPSPLIKQLITLPDLLRRASLGKGNLRCRGSSAEFKDCFTNEIDKNLSERQNCMANENVLAEKEFDIPVDDQNYKIKAMATFLIHDVAPQERGIYILNFTLGGQHAETTQLDEAYYSREGARRAAEFAFSSGEVEAFVKRQIQSWINLGR
jgi:hypothetical protein